MSKKMYETHKKSGKNDGHKPTDNEKNSKKTPARYENFEGKPIE